jgi:hypothetical protein
MTDEKEIYIHENRGKFVPPYIFSELPGINRAVQRNWFLHQKRLVPVSFVNVLLDFSIGLATRVGSFFMIHSLMGELILDHLPGLSILAVILFGSYWLYNWVILKNDPKLQEELILEGVLALISSGIALWIVLV